MASAAFPPGDGELARLIRRRDWSATPLGPVDRWRPELKATVSLMLQSPVGCALLWGECGLLLYNDAYSVIAAARHPHILGLPAEAAFPELADWNRSILEAGLRGDVRSFKDQPLVLDRGAGPEEAWFTLDYSPVLDAGGKALGVFAIVTETTARVRAESELALQRRRIEAANRRLTAESEFLQQLLEAAPTFMCLLSGRDHRFRLTNAAYRRLIGHRDVLGVPLRQALPEVEGQGFVEILDRVLATGERHVGAGAEVLLQTSADGPLERRIVDFVYQPITDADGAISGVFVAGQDVTERVRGEDHLRLLVHELNHRVKNTLTIVQAIAHQSLRGEDVGPEARATFEGRLTALAGAHDILTRASWESAGLQELVRQALTPFAEQAGGRIRVSGPDLLLAPRTAVSMALAIHELATNASKYGALSGLAGEVGVEWDVVRSDDEARLALRWQERGGPPVRPPTRNGFGLRLIRRAMEAELGGRVKLDFALDGVTCVIDAPLERLEALREAAAQPLAPPPPAGHAA